MQRISQAKAVPEDEIKKELTRLDIPPDNLEELVKGGVVEKREVLICRQTSSQLLALTATTAGQQIGREAFQSMLCPHCSRSFNEERSSHVYDLGNVGKKLMEGSHWLTVWVTMKLLDLGVSIHDISWSVEDGSDEADIVLLFESEIWIFELKDREFGAGDAHKFSFRRTCFSATRSFIVTTDKVSNDARSVFDELKRQSENSPSARLVSLPIYIEGLNNLSDAILAEA